jgi:SAM-dependent methyltransferase
VTKQTERGLLDEVNRTHWQDDDVVGDMGRLIGWSDPGEPRAVGVVASGCRSRPVLDIGIGTGRTTTYLTLLSDDYVGIDYTPAMVESAKARHPGRDLQHGDARDLSAWSDDRFALVMFSFNGLDAVDHDDRAVALREFARVVAPDGYVVYSTHNKLGPVYRETPWHWARRHAGNRPRWLRIVKAVVLAPQRFRERRPVYLAWLRLRGRATDKDTWGLSPLAVHDYRFVVHFISLAAAVAEAAAVRLDVVAVFGNDGRTYAVDDDTSGVDYFHLVLRKALPTR